MDDAAMERFAGRLERARPAIVMGYATALDLFASYLLRKGRRGIRPRVVRSAAEALSSAARERIARGFDSPVRDFYGSRECPSLAAECARGRLHVLAHGRAVELVDDRGEPVPPGVPGRVLVTDFKNRAFGLVRYENGDVAAWDEDRSPCACGCPFPRLARVYGRTSDFVTTPAGERVHGEWFTHLFYGAEGVERFQVRQESLTSVVVATVGPAGEATLAPLLALMRERMGPAVEVAWRRVDEIPATRTGKHRFTVSEVPFLPGERR
jgi:phenylacetate-coenzyme A ligase PaaK-like adenylate-forming protein